MKQRVIFLLLALALFMTGNPGTAGQSRTVQYEYDASGRLVRMVSVTGEIAVTDYQFDAAGNLLATVEGPTPEVIFSSGFEAGQ